MAMATLAQVSRDPPRPEPTLDEALRGIWAGLVQGRTVLCPVCRGEMAPQYGAQALPVGGRCRRCGATLS